MALVERGVVPGGLDGLLRPGAGPCQGLACSLVPPLSVGARLIGADNRMKPETNLH
jgi:hypothetical protein